MIGVTVARRNISAQVLAEVKARMIPRIVSGLNAASIHILAEACELTPIDTNALRDTARIHQLGSGEDTVFVIGFGPKGVVITDYSQAEGRPVTRIPYEYAVLVHEDRSMGHPRGGQADFLRTPLADHPAICSVFNVGAGVGP